MSSHNLLAHSANKDGVTQTFRDHTLNVVREASENALGVVSYVPNGRFKELFLNAVRLSAFLHDFGKVDPIFEQPTYLKGIKENPSNHVDAGVAITWARKHCTPAIIIKSHHWGLSNFCDLIGKHRDDATILSNGKTQSKYCDENLDFFYKTFKTELPEFAWLSENDTQFIREMPPTFWRFALSCLCDADNSDTACHFLNERITPALSLQAQKLHDRLVTYVNSLFSDKFASAANSGEKRRCELRMALFKECLNYKVGREKIVSLPAPVGSGKSLAALACLLSVAQQMGLRRIFWVLPYTSIIDQGVQEYIKALVDSGVPPESIVTANHSKMEFGSYEHRHLSSNWKTQIIITTASAFFETIGSKKSRKLHYLAGSGVFVDEFHSLPMKLWKPTFQWIKELTESFGCFFILGSGTLIKGWELKEFEMYESIPSLISPDLFKKLERMEKQRIDFKSLGNVGLEELLNRVCRHRTSTLLVCSTKRNAAFIAKELVRRGKKVEHLSTSLHSQSRKITIARIHERLKNNENFILVATSCIEAGMDFSFHNGYRERDSVESLIQTGGRVNRNFQCSKAVCYDFVFNPHPSLSKNPQFVHERQLLSNLFATNSRIDFNKMTEYMQRRFEMECGTILDFNAQLLQHERERSFESVDRKYRIVDSPTQSVLINSALAEDIKNGKNVSFREIEKWSVHVYPNSLEKLDVYELIRDTDQSLWVLNSPDLNYDDFTGYMRAFQ